MLTAQQQATKAKTVIHCKTAGDIPKEKHWAIIETEIATERGRDQGDRDTNFNYVTYMAYLVQEEWAKEVVERTSKVLQSGEYSYGHKEFVAMEVQPAAVTTKISVTVGLPQ